MTMQESKTTLYIDAYSAGSSVLVILKGRLVLENCEAARKRLNALLTDQVESFYLYLGRLEFADSAGWGAMVALKLAANRNRTRMVFLSPMPRILDIFRISKLDTIFEILQGPEAEVIRSGLVKRENLLFRDSPDESQNRFSTETPGTPAMSRPPTPPGPGAEAASISPELAKEAERLTRDAVEHLRQGDFQKAIDLYKRLLEIQPDDLSALNNLGVVYEKRQEWFPDAIKTWKRVQELSQRRNDAKHAERARKHLEFLQAKPPS